MAYFRSVRKFELTVYETLRGIFLIISFCGFVALTTGSEVCGVETATSSGSFKNPDAIQRVLSGEETVANAAWWGFDSSDSTHALQGAINSGAKKVVIPYVGKEWIVQPIKLAGNQEIVFESGVVVIAKKGEFKGKRDCLFSASGLSNITLRGYGATLRMRKSDYASFKYIKSEWRHILKFLGCSNVNVLGLRLENSGGDGICIGSTEDKHLTPCKNVLIRDCICDKNYRQGISVTSVDKLLIENCKLSNTSGTRPKAGIDLEPNTEFGNLVNVVISNCIAENNVGAGFLVNISRLSAKSREISVLFVNCHVKSGYAPGLMVLDDSAARYPKGLIEFKNCTCEDTTYSGVFVRLKSASAIKTRFSNCKWENVATRRTKVPIELVLKKKEAVGQAEGIEFIDCHVYDKKNRPFLKVSDVETGKGVYNIKGEINVINPYGARMDLGTAGGKLPLKVKSFKTRR